MNELHIDLLIGLRAAKQYGLDVPTLLVDLRRGRHRDLAQPQLEQALRSLADDSFATTFTTVLKSKRWRITALGESALQEASL